MSISQIQEKISPKTRTRDGESFLDRCTSCGVCTRACAFLRTHGKPDGIISRADQNLFLCTNCGACTSLCPLGLDPAETLFESKHQLIESGRVPLQVSKALGSARRFVRWGRSFPFSFHSRTATVFWPGCSLAGMAPHIVGKTRHLLSEKLGEEVGLALDCCGDPAYQLGDLLSAQSRTREIRESFEEHGITKVIAGCANCVKVLSKYLPGMNIKHVVEVLAGAVTANLPSDGNIYLHHPCPSYCFESIREGALRLCGDREIDEQMRPQCCGQGGSLPALSPESASLCTSKIFRAAREATLVTYCMGCKDQFLREGKQAHHLLELLVSARPVDRPLSSVRKWWNRFVLRLKAHIGKGIL